MGRFSYVFGFLLAAAYTIVVLLIFSRNWAASLIAISGALWLLRDRFAGASMLVLAAVLLVPDPL